MVRAEHAGLQGDRPLQLLGVLSTAQILGLRGLFEPGLRRDVRQLQTGEQHAQASERGCNHAGTGRAHGDTHADQVFSSDPFRIFSMSAT